MLKKVRKQFLDPTCYLDVHQNLTESFLGRDPSSIQLLGILFNTVCVIVLTNNGHKPKHNLLGRHKCVYSA